MVLPFWQGKIVWGIQIIINTIELSSVSSSYECGDGRKTSH
jgi:hypothetical protein